MNCDNLKFCALRHFMGKKNLLYPVKELYLRCKILEIWQKIIRFFCGKFTKECFMETYVPTIERSEMACI